MDERELKEEGQRYAERTFANINFRANDIVYDGLVQNDLQLKTSSTKTPKTEPYSDKFSSILEIFSKTYTFTVENFNLKVLLKTDTWNLTFWHMT